MAIYGNTWFSYRIGNTDGRREGWTDERTAGTSTMWATMTGQIAIIGNLTQVDYDDMWLPLLVTGGTYYVVSGLYGREIGKRLNMVAVTHSTDRIAQHGIGNADSLRIATVTWFGEIGKSPPL